jgi:hypothetical protein
LVFFVIPLSEFRVFDRVYFFCTANIVIYRLLFIMELLLGKVQELTIIEFRGGFPNFPHNLQKTEKEWKIKNEKTGHRLYDKRLY